MPNWSAETALNSLMATVHGNDQAVARSLLRETGMHGFNCQTARVFECNLLLPIHALRSNMSGSAIRSQLLSERDRGIEYFVKRADRGHDGLVVLIGAHDLVELPGVR